MLSFPKFSLVRFILFSVFLLLIPITSYAQPPTEGGDRQRFNLETMPHQTGWDTANTSNRVSAPTILSWSKVAFQSYRNSNWDIYVGNDDGSGQTAVAASTSSEIQPHLNRGNTKLVYASNSGGDYEIYTANADGSAKTLLTANNTSDGNPSWSPDGSKIVFEAYRNGNADIYVMNADGSNQKQLTTSADFDGMPTWSPDGTKIAFSSRRTGSYRIYVMNADGTGQTQLSNQPYSFRPQWSPDGKLIAYDADNDNDGFQDLWRMNADGSAQTLVYNPSGQTDTWTASWSPDGNYITYTLISFIQYQGNWYWTTAFLEARTLAGSTVRLSSSSLDWEPAWQTGDNLAPTVAFSPIPPLQTGSPSISWSGSDLGNAGMASYDVQYRPASTNNWVAWQNFTILTSAAFTGQGGESYTFRVRARDKAHNVTPWLLSSNPLTLYAWSVNGQVSDNVGTPVQSATIATTPGLFLGGSSLPDGSYATYVGQESTNYSVQLSKAGYGSVPATAFTNVVTDNRFDVVLPPLDNVIQDGGFEASPYSLSAHWQTGGTYNITPEVTVSSHSGIFSAGVGNKVTPAPVYYTPKAQLFDGDSFDSTPQIAVAPNQLVHVVWRHNSTGDIYHAHQVNSTTWSTPVRISANTTSNTTDEQIQIAANNSIHITWQEGGEVYYTWRSESGSWATPAIISNGGVANSTTAAVSLYHGNTFSLAFAKTATVGGTNSIYVRSRDLATGSWSPIETVATGLSQGHITFNTDNANKLHLTWWPWSYLTSAFYWQKGVTGPWSSAQNIPIIFGVNSAEVIVAPNGEVHFISWDDSDQSLYHTRRSVAGSWSTPYLISEQRTQHFTAQAFATDTNGLHVVWTVNPQGTGGDSWGLYHAYRTNGGQWGPIEKISSEERYARATMFVKANLGHAYLIYMVQDPNTSFFDYYFGVFTAEGGWSIPFRMFMNEYKFGTAAVASDGRLHSIVYQSSGTGLGLYHDVATFQVGDSTLSQTVAVPTTLQNPYLSFNYKASGGSLLAQSGFQVIVDNGSAQTVEFEAYANDLTWQHAAVDISRWQNQTITLTWRTNKLPVAMPYYLQLDDISLGSAHPDLWLDTAGATSALPNEQVEYVLTYGNQSPVTGDGAELVITLPAHLKYVSASPSPTSITPVLRWDLGDLPAESAPFNISLMLKVDASAPKLTTLMAEVAIDSNDSELENLNNQTILSLFVGRFVYLPMIQK
ncbi:MAG: PD40 domain-containing protein [Anaerolineaceae bacterium]|nr:PD40 domain-containing protein [Anaerolineaceae bacterium]